MCTRGQFKAPLDLRCGHSIMLAILGHQISGHPTHDFEACRDGGYVGHPAQYDQT